jgi:type IV pilus assembly protein PilB
MRARPSPTERLAAGLAPEACAAWAPYAARGCPVCHGIGYRGRIGIHQVMPASPAVRELVSAGASTQALARQAHADGAAPLREAALARARDGVTSIAEAIATTDAL